MADGAHGPVRRAGSGAESGPSFYLSAGSEQNASPTATTTDPPMMALLELPADSRSTPRAVLSQNWNNGAIDTDARADAIQ